MNTHEEYLRDMAKREDESIQKSERNRAAAIAGADAIAIVVKIQNECLAEDQIDSVVRAWMAVHDD